jgi:predicted HTH transcriptional regulator
LAAIELFSSDLETISIADVQDFLGINAPEEQRPPEGVRIDYKLKEPSDLADTVAAFANTAGGLIFIGVESKKEKHNVPISLPGAAFHGGDIRARIIGKITSQVTPRPEVDVAVVRQAIETANSIVIVRVKEGIWPPYQSAIGDRVRIPLRLSAPA